MNPRGAVLTALMLTLGCSSAKIAGGSTVVPGDEPEGDRIGLWRTTECRDGKGGPAIEPFAKVEVIRTKSERKLVLVDTRIGYDTLVSENGQLKAGEWVFDVALKKEQGRPYLRQYRFPESLGGSGRYLLTADFVDWEAGDAFHARVVTIGVECTLGPSES